MNTMPDVTFIIPIGLSHKTVSARAIASVNAQTIPVLMLTMLDIQHQGPGALRNQMLKQVNTEFVTFLDADDWIEETFAEDCLAEYRRIGGGKYIYTDWIDAKGMFVRTPCLTGPNGHPIPVPAQKPYCGGTWHPITTLLPTEWVKAVGGFDEQLPAVEDTDFFLKLCTTNHCGHRLDKPLFHYVPNGGRAAAFYQGTEQPRVMAELSKRYEGKMGCCGDDPKDVKPVGERQPGDVLARMRWHGNRKEHGTITGRMYPRGSFPATAWIDPRDAADMPDLWTVVDRPVDQSQGITTLEHLATLGMATIPQRPALQPDPPAPVSPVEIKPDIQRVVSLARQTWLNEPVFVFPDKDYPSYGDIKRLVEVSGFQSISMNQFDMNSRAPYIVVSPEVIPDLRAMSRVIAWQLEYAGDYTHNYDAFIGEVWASDKAWAERHHAKYVLMGSHEDLAEKVIEKATERTFDVTMLGYMIPRRQAIKEQLSDLRWPVDYPGHGTLERASVLGRTRLMLHVHQHDNAPYLAPQRIALAAAYHMPVISEVTPGLGDLSDQVILGAYTQLPDLVRHFLATPTRLGHELHEYLCIQHPFRQCVEEALKS